MERMCHSADYEGRGWGGERGGGKQDRLYTCDSTVRLEGMLAL